MSMFLRFFFPPPPSLFVNAMSVFSLVSLSVLGLSEIKGEHLNYSKFWNVESQIRRRSSGIKLPSRTGMLVLYTPALLAALVSFGFLSQDGSLRTLLVSSALFIHFLKRDLEVLFIHKYSGAMMLDHAIPISLSYFFSTVASFYSQYLSQQLPEPSADLKPFGVVLFLIGIAGNFYHHYLLSNLRGKEDRGYKIPKGGLFSLVICPPYLFEVVGFVGVSCFSQTLYTFCFTLGSFFYLLGRSHATRKWYIARFPNFPKQIKSMIPYVF
ncbi:uncharacterized protein [Aristolochia californica]|uniref:uncharacterized protein n=1 Tax=Aristolochia californica TaxID=171875 RepID=UPI0035DD3A68